MKFTQFPVSDIYAGNIDIFYHNGDSFVPVTGRLVDGFTNTIPREQIQIDFDTVTSSMFKIVLKNHDQSTVGYLGIAE